MGFNYNGSHERTIKRKYINLEILLNYVCFKDVGKLGTDKHLYLIFLSLSLQ